MDHIVICQVHESCETKFWFVQGGLDRTEVKPWTPPPLRSREEYESHGSAPSDFSGSEDDSEHLFTDAESEDNPLSGNSSVESAAFSDVEQVRVLVTGDNSSLFMVLNEVSDMYISFPFQY